MRIHAETDGNTQQDATQIPGAPQLAREKLNISFDDLDDTEKDELVDENMRLKEQKTCKVCMDAEVGVVFLPCGHLVVCVNCAPNLKVTNNHKLDNRFTVEIFYRPVPCAGRKFKGQFEHFSPEKWCDGKLLICWIYIRTAESVAGVSFDSGCRLSKKLILGFNIPF